MITVRPADEKDRADVEAIAATATATLRQTYRPTPAALANRSQLARSLQRLVATCDGRVVGTVQYWVEDRIVRVIGLGVHPEYRRQGVARSLLQALEAIGNQHQAVAVRLHTVRETGNVEVFQRLGFSIIAEQEDLFSESDVYSRLTDVEMEKRCSSRSVSCY